MLGVMLDCSRNAVPTVANVKEHIDDMKKMGYDTLMLYTEDTFEVDNEPYFGYLRGRYTKEELKEIVAYGNENGIETIPCIQTLAHVGAIFHWPEYKPMKDIMDIMLIGDDRTWVLLENIFKTLREVFTSNKIHIGMDEAHSVGLGKYLDKNGYRDRFDTILEHLEKVCEMCEKYGFEPMMWSDMFFRLACEGDYYGDINPELAKKAKEKMPKNIKLVYWDYYSYDRKHYARMFRQHKEICPDIIFANGSWTWNGFVPGFDKAMSTLKPGMEEAANQGVRDVLVTTWGDDGFECPFLLALPMYFLTAEYARGNFDLESIKVKFKELFDEDFDDMVSLEEMNQIKKYETIKEVFMSKIYLYNDVLLGAFDTHVPEDTEGRYTTLAAKYREAAKKSKRFALEFEYAAVLCELLALKADLGLKLRTAYQAGDKAALVVLAQKTLPETIARGEAFLKIYKKVWFKEKKPYGFDVQELRLSFVIRRLQSAMERVTDYLNGDCESIDELEETILETPIELQTWQKIATASAFSFNQVDIL